MTPNWTDLERVRGELLEVCRKSRPELVVAFDADSTLWMSDVANRLWSYLLSERLLRPEGGLMVTRTLQEQGGEPSGDPHQDMTQLMGRYAAGQADERALVAVQATGLAGFSVPELRAIARASFKHGDNPLWDLLFEGMGDLMASLRAHGARCVVISGSPQIAVEEAVLFYGTPREDVAALRSRLEGGRLLPELEGPFTSGEGKVAAYFALSPTPPIAAFGDGPSDIPLLSLATNLAGMVNPRPGLRAASANIKAPVRWIRISRTVAGIPAELPEQDESTII